MPCPTAEAINFTDPQGTFATANILRTLASSKKGYTSKSHSSRSTVGEVQLWQTQSTKTLSNR